MIRLDTSVSAVLDLTPDLERIVCRKFAEDGSRRKKRLMVELIEQFGFPIVAMGLGYFVYYVWRTIINIINRYKRNAFYTN